MRLGNRQSCVTRRCQPSFHRDAHFSNRFLGGVAEGCARLQVRNIGNPGAVVIRPEYDDGVAVHRQCSKVNSNSRINRVGDANYSHSIVPGGFDVRS